VFDSTMTHSTCCYLPSRTQRLTRNSQPDVRATPLAIPTWVALCLHPQPHRWRLLLGALTMKRVCS